MAEDGGEVHGRSIMSLPLPTTYGIVYFPTKIFSIPADNVPYIISPLYFQCLAGSLLGRV